MRRWLVELDGERSDVEEFPERFPDGDIHAVENDGKVYLTGSAFDQFSEGQLVRNHAMGAVEEMCAIISLLWPAFRKPLVGSVYREDGNGGRSTWLFPVTGTLRIKSGDVRTSGGTEVTAPGPTPAPKATCGVENNRLPARDGSSVGGGGPRMVASLSHCRRANRAPRYDACQGRSLFRKRTRTLRAHF